jgi:arginyl-tRNA--protein-N-Asp/Glu arginylyltransferase
MFAQIYSPESRITYELDDYLERGWFRMGQNLFTTNFINFNETLYSTLWLRIPLASYQEDSTHKKLSKQNKRFTTIIRDACLTAEKEMLYARYKESLAFQPSDSLRNLLYGKEPSEPPFDTKEIVVYDQDKLIAIGFFDIGHKSAEGIVSVYDPDYKKFSLGKYLIQQKIAYCKERGMEFFYPGYFVPGYSFFDYKLTIGKEVLEYFDISTLKWLHINSFQKEETPIKIIYDKLYQLQSHIQYHDFETEVLRYEFFDANLVPQLKDAELFDYPVILLNKDAVYDVFNIVVVYDIRDHHFHIIRFHRIWEPEMPVIHEGSYARYLLRSDQIIFSSDNVDMIATIYYNLLMRLQETHKPSE